MIHVRDKKLLAAFGIHLRALRQSKGLSQQKLAYKADVSLSQISRIERGLLNPTLSTLSALTKALNISLATMVTFDITSVNT